MSLHELTPNARTVCRTGCCRRWCVCDDCTLPHEENIEENERGEVNMERTFKEIQDIFWKPTESNNQVEGYLINRKRGGQYNSLIYELQTERNEFLAFYGGKVLDDKTSEVKDGQYVRFTFLGMKKNAMGKDYADWKVEIGELTLPAPNDDDHV